MQSQPKLKLSFWGGVDVVTGSRHLLEYGDTRILLDCGLFQGHRKEAIQENRQFHFDPKNLSAVLLSHAHVDHCGSLPLLVKKGYRQTIHCTHPTQEISRVMLMDSAYIQEEDAKFFNKVHREDGETIEPLYDQEDVKQTMELFRGHAYEEPFELAPGISAKFLDAGHVLGSAMIEVVFRTAQGSRCVLFTGDMGRRKNILMNAPSIPKSVDYLITESTYGNRLHDPIQSAEKKLVAAIQSCVAEKGKILIPSFALERTQEIVYMLGKLYRRNKMNPIPLYVDSPMAVNITDIFKRYEEYFSKEVRGDMGKDEEYFGAENIHFVRSVEESKQLNEKPGPMIILSASGMCEGGRILHHLRNNIDKESTLILIVGYQAEGTLGRQLVEGARKVKIFGLKHEVLARVNKIRNFSAHADRDDLLWFIKSLASRPRHIFLVHGDANNRLPFVETLKAEGIDRVTAPSYGETIELE